MIIFEIPRLKKRVRVNRLALIIGSMFPDIMDKSLTFLQFTNGRCYFHSLLYVFICFGILFLFSRMNKPISFSFLLGELFHLLLDLPEIPLFYPFINYDFNYQGDPIPKWIHTLLTDPIVQITEILGGIFFCFIIINNRLFKFNNILNYLKTNSKSIDLIKKDAKVVLAETNQ